MQTFDTIVAGAGIWGCTVARRLAEAGKRVLVLEKRAAAGGNCRCEIDPTTGIEVHTYGSHIFHTSNEEVWKFVRRFTKFNDYRHCVLARTKKVGVKSEKLEKGNIIHSSTLNFNSSPSPTLNSNSYHTYHLPIGCTLLKEFFGREIKPSEMTDDERTQLFDAFIRGYTSKQWGVAPEKVDPSIIARLKVRDNYSTDYFDDPYQGIPSDGYNKMFERMLEHPNIVLRTSSSLRFEKEVGVNSKKLEKGCFSIFDEQTGEKIPFSNSNSSLQLYYSGPIDALFNYKFGALPWRTLRFERETLPVADYQGNSVVNYTDADVPFTRIHEFKHYHPEWGGGEGQRSKVRGQTAEGDFERGCSVLAASPKDETTAVQPPTSNLQPSTIIMREYSATWQPGDEPYYPISTPESAALLAKYQAEIEKINNFSFLTSHFSLVVGGRLGQYKYYDMDKSIAAALAVCI